MKRRKVGNTRKANIMTKKGLDADLYHSQSYWEERYQNKTGYHEW